MATFGNNTPMTTGSDKDLGMDRPIARRDFLQGAAIGVGGVYGRGNRASTSRRRRADQSLTVYTACDMQKIPRPESLAAEA